MAILSNLMSALPASLLTDARAAMRRYGLRILLAALAALVGTFGLAMLVGSAFLWLAECMTAPAAAAVTGAGLLVAAGLIALTAALLGRRRSRRTTSKATDGGAAGIANTLAALQTAIGRDVRADAPTMALAALLAGCAIGASPRLRRAIAALAR